MHICIDFICIGSLNKAAWKNEAILEEMIYSIGIAYMGSLILIVSKTLSLLATIIISHDYNNVAIRGAYTEINAKKGV